MLSMPVWPSGLRTTIHRMTKASNLRCGAVKDGENRHHFCGGAATFGLTYGIVYLAEISCTLIATFDLNFTLVVTIPFLKVNVLKLRLGR